MLGYFTVLFILRGIFDKYVFITLGFFALLIACMIATLFIERRAINGEGFNRDKTINDERNAIALQTIARERFYVPHIAPFNVPENPRKLRIYSDELAIYVDYAVWIADECLKILPKWHAKTVTIRKVEDLPTTLDLTEAYKLTCIPLDEIEFFSKADAPPSVSQPKGGHKTVLTTANGTPDYPATAYEVFTRLFPDKAR